MSMQLLDIDFETPDPLSVIETVAFKSSMDSERVDEAELHVNLGGLWRDVAVWFAWREDMSVLQMGAPLELKVPTEKRDEIFKLLALINERVWLGHFDIWAKDNEVVYRNGTVLSEMAEFDSSQAEILIRGAVEAVERFYPCFNFVIWGDKTAEEAIEASMLDVQGTA